MALIDISNKISAELASRHPFLVNAAKSCIGWTARIENNVLGRTIQDADEASRGAFITQEGYLIVYGLRKRFLKIEWSIGEAFPLRDLQFQYQYLLDIPELIVDCRQEPKLAMKLTISLMDKDSELLKPHVLPGFPGHAIVDGAKFEVPAHTIHLYLQENQPVSPVPALVGRSEKAIHLKYWQNESCKSLVLNDLDFLGDIQYGDLRFYTWRQPKSGVIAVHFAQRDELANRTLGNFSSAPLQQVTVAQLPITLEVKSTLEGSRFDDRCIGILPPNRPLAFVDSHGRIRTLPPDTSYHFLRNGLVFVDPSSNTCGTMRHYFYGTSNLHQQWGINLSNAPTSHNEFLAYLAPESDSSQERVELLALENLVFRTKVGLSQLSTSAENIHRITHCEYAIRSQNDTIWRAKLDPEDDMRFRQSILQSQVDGRIAHSTGIAKLYEVAIDLQANRFMELLFNELFLLFDEMERAPSPEALIDTITSETKLDTESRQAILGKIILLAETLPGLKRSLERTGTFYPYQMRGGDDSWLTKVFGQECANHWERTHGRSEVSQIRGFVRNVQANLWRSLVETERSLTRLEPVYSERLKLARSKATKRNIVTSLGHTTASLVTACATGQLYLPFASSLQVANLALSYFETNQQNDAILIDHGLEVLRWWSVFRETFAVQVHESQEYIRNHLDQLAKRDCELFKKVAATEQLRFTQHLKFHLEQRIQRESEGRFQVLGIGSLQLKQDLIEGLGRLASQGNTLRIGHTSL